MRKKTYLTNDIDMAKVFLEPFIQGNTRFNETFSDGTSLYESETLLVIIFPENLFNKDNLSKEGLLKALNQEDKTSLLITMLPLVFEKFLNDTIFKLSRGNVSQTKITPVPVNQVDFFITYERWINLEEYLFDKTIGIDSEQTICIENKSSDIGTIFSEGRIIRKYNLTLMGIILSLKKYEFNKITCCHIIFMKYHLMRVFLPKGSDSSGRYSYTKKFVSRPSHHRKPVIEKWKNYFSDLLWSTTRLIQQKVKNTGYRLFIPNNLSAWKKIFNNDADQGVGRKMVSPIN